MTSSKRPVPSRFSSRSRSYGSASARRRSGRPFTPDQRLKEDSQMGLTDKITGRFKKAAGDLADDPSLRREGRKEERKGEAKDELSHAQERVEDKAAEVSDLERKT